MAGRRLHSTPVAFCSTDGRFAEILFICLDRTTSRAFAVEAATEKVSKTDNRSKGTNLRAARQPPSRSALIIN